MCEVGGLKPLKPLLGMALACCANVAQVHSQITWGFLKGVVLRGEKNSIGAKMASMQKTNSRGEEIEQALVIKWSHKVAVRALMPELRWLHHSPAGGKRDAFVGAQMRALGVKRGFPDLILPVWVGGPSGFSSGLVIEMKSAIGRTSPEQKEWLAHFEAQKWQVEIARSAQEAREMLCRYLGTRPQDAPELI